MVLPLLSTDIIEEISGITTGILEYPQILPLTSTNILQVISLLYQWLFQRHFLWDSARKLNIATFRVSWRNFLSVNRQPHEPGEISGRNTGEK